MFEIPGKYTTAKVMIDELEPSCVSQINGFVNHPAFTNPIAIMPDCLEFDTEVLTETGFKLIRSLSKKDKIANVDLTTKKVFFKPPKTIIRRSLRPDEKAYSLDFSAFKSSIISSENHRNIFGESLNIVDVVTTKELPDISKTKNFSWSARGLKTPKRTNLSIYEILLIAWIVGDGSIKVTKNQKSNNYRIRFGLKKERKIERILYLSRRIGLNPKVTNYHNQVEIIFNTKESKKYIDIVTLGKKYPQMFLKHLNRDEANLFILELVKVDGDFSNFTKFGTIRINSKRKEDMDFISALVAINFGTSGIKERISVGFGKKIKKYYIQITPEHKTLYSKSGLHNKNVIKNEIRYQKEVVCLTCHSGFFIARQKGRTFVTGNSHAGKGSVIGFTMEMTDKVIPNVVGVDINCSVMCFNFGKLLPTNFEIIDQRIRQRVPFGNNIHERSTSPIHFKNDFPFRESSVLCEKFTLAYNTKFGTRFAPIRYDMDWFENKCKSIGTDLGYAISSIGTLGGGNHFISIDVDESGDYWISIHTGSRNFGKRICDYWQNKASKNVRKSKQAELQKRIEDIRQKYTGMEIKKQIRKAREDLGLDENVSSELQYLEGEDAIGYLQDMVFTQYYSLTNRNFIAKIIQDALKINQFDIIETPHNFIDFRDFIIRKGAIRSYTGERFVIPMSPKDGILICEGKSNPEWNFSASHGCGRLMSRAQAKKTISDDQVEKEMEGIFASVKPKDESPLAYKNAKIIEKYLEPTVKVLGKLKPVLNMKDG